MIAKLFECRLCKQKSPTRGQPVGVTPSYCPVYLPRALMPASLRWVNRGSNCVSEDEVGVGRWYGDLFLLSLFFRLKHQCVQCVWKIRSRIKAERGKVPWEGPPVFKARIPYTPLIKPQFMHFPEHYGFIWFIYFYMLPTWRWITHPNSSAVFNLKQVILYMKE